LFSLGNVLLVNNEIKSWYFSQNFQKVTYFMDKTVIQSCQS